MNIVRLSGKQHVKFSKGAIAGTAVVIAASYMITLLPPDQIIRLTAEDGIIENLGSLCFLITSSLLLAAWLKSDSFPTKPGPVKTRQNATYFGFALLFFFAAGEEISWGQRVFVWSTPESLAEVN